ncbi:anti-sigma factor [Saccharibacillus sacchari]|uniref:anti-sigma factor n=1 Tax=Saccharibacillus sacchari TaxID=456493 RepID=UPI0004BC03F7|nr:anti-sigma factor [Saccharibacillus sacchari]
MSERKESMMELAEAYVLGELDATEQAEYEAFLHDDAEERQRVTELRDTTGMLALAVRPAAPPTGMKARILANVLGSSGAVDTQQGHEPEALLEQARQGIEAEAIRRAAEERSNIIQATDTVQGSAGANASQGAHVVSLSDHAQDQTTASDSKKQLSSATRTDSEPRNAQTRISRSLWAGAAALMAAAAVILAIYSGQLRSEMNEMRSNLTAMEQRTSDMEQQLAAANEPAVGAQVDRTVALVGSEDDPNASGMAAMVQDDTGTRLVVQASDLPALSGNEAYQVWLIKDGQPINAGTFLSGDGKGALTYTMEPGDYDMVAITLEPDAEGDQPRGRMVLTGALT